MNPSEYVKQARPVADPAAIITNGKYRITMLTTALARLEYSEEGNFEDRPTQKVLNRDFPVPEFTVSRGGGELLITTKDMEIRYDEQEFTGRGLTIKAAGGRAWERTWHYGEEPKDLLGTARTLDKTDGAVPLEHGLMSQNGYSVMDDSGSMALTEDGFVEPRKRSDRDFYFFAYGHRYLDCLSDFYHLCGKTPLLPRFAFGNWWSRYHRYTEAEYRGLMTRFEQEKIPFSVAVIDMDWHLVDDVDPVYGSGWTGYTWNTAFFPNPEDFMSWLHKHGLRVTLNLHPADGIRAYEESYPAMARSMGIDPETKEPVAFDVTDPKFIRNYFDEVLHPLEQQGVDFWWLDWQQGTLTKVEGLDPLWMLNHYHYIDSSRDGKRPLTFSRYAGPGSHRYPVGFSGDTTISWASLKFQPYFTANASNIGYGWWSHDIGGHMHGVRDDDLAARWVQLGVFSPILRLHSTDNPFNGKEPWNYRPDIGENMKEFLRLRNRMVPYLYTMNRAASHEDLPLVRPMYYHDPEEPAAYEVPNCFWFGTEMIAAPITDPIDPKTFTASAPAWLPEGVWYDVFCGRRYEGGRKIDLWRSQYDIPVLAKAGAIIPLKSAEPYDNSTDNPQFLDVHVFPGTSGEFTMWEDDGECAEDRAENWSSTKMTLTNGLAEGTVFRIGPAEGNRDVIPGVRTWRISFRHTKKTHVKVSVPAEFRYDDETQTLLIEAADVPADQEIVVAFPEGMHEADEDLIRPLQAFLMKAQIEHDLKAELVELVRRYGRGAVSAILAKHLPRALEGTVLEILTA